VQITKEEFARLKRAKDTLTKLFLLTDNYRVVVESYRSLEKAKHDEELNYMLSSSAIRSEDIIDLRVTLNSQILGYLANARYFLDSTNRLLPKILSPEQVRSFKKLQIGMYDSIREYRFIEALRNYVQHRGLPIHIVQHHNFLEDETNLDTSDQVVSLSLLSKRMTLKQDDKFKKAALDGMPEDINIIECVRFHMEVMWKLHDYLIRNHSQLADDVRAVVSEAIQRCKAGTKEKIMSICAIAQLSETEVYEEIPLLLNWDDARREALKRIGNLNNLHKRYISGKIKK